MNNHFTELHLRSYGNNHAIAIPDPMPDRRSLPLKRVFLLLPEPPAVVPKSWLLSILTIYHKSFEQVGYPGWYDLLTEQVMAEENHLKSYQSLWLVENSPEAFCLCSL